MGRDDARDGLDKAALILAFLAGAGGSVALKLLDAPVLVAALWPVGVLAVYVAGTFATRSAMIEPEAVGDNCYYLGFLFTLSSLAVTLYQIRGTAGAAGADLIPQVIAGFGVALSSTIAGVFLRVMLMQVRPDLGAQDREARRDLAVGAREFRTAIGAATRGLKGIAVEQAQHVAERNAHLDAITERHGEAVAALIVAQSERFEAATAEMTMRLGEATDRLVAAMDAVALAADARDAPPARPGPDLRVLPTRAIAEAPAPWPTAPSARRDPS